MKRAADGSESPSPNAVPNVTLHAALNAVIRRARLQRALDAWVALAALSSGLLIAQALFAQREPMLIWPLALTLPCVGAALWAARRVPALPIARAIDGALATPELVASAVAFEALPAAEQTPFMRACVAQAELASARLEPGRAIAFHVPSALPVLCALGLALIGLSHRAAHQPVASLTAKAPVAPVIEAETAAAFAREVEALRAAPLDPAAQELVNKLNALLEGIAAGEIDRAEALAELRRLEERLESLLATDPKALEAALEQIGRALGGTPEAKPLEKALSENWPDAARELRRLSERVAKEELKASAQERLASGLARAAEQRSAGEQQAAIDSAKRELDRLLRDQEKGGAQDADREQRDERLLKRKERELDRLEREQSRQQAADRQLDQLQRELDAASKAMSEKNQQSAAEKLQNAARELERAAQQQQARSQSGRLAQQLAQLRAEIAQRSGQSRPSAGKQSGDGAPVPLSMQRYGQMASGKVGEEGGPGSEPGAQPQNGQAGQQPGSPGDRLAQLRQGQGQGQGAPQGGEKTALMEQSMAPSDEPGEGQGAGSGGKPKSGPATAGTGQHVDTRIEGEKRAGPSRSEVIFESGQRGFANESYAQVHDDYVRHAESVLEREHIPGGYRYYVRRYFQLIRPREGAPAEPAQTP